MKTKIELGLVHTLADVPTGDVFYRSALLRANRAELKAAAKIVSKRLDLVNRKLAALPSK